MQLLRRAFFYLFLALYLVITPLAILYAFGYQFRPGQRQALVRTGVISLDTVPGNARVYLGNSRYRWKTPTLLRDVKPGHYPVRLALRGYQTWSARVGVEPEKAVVLDRILLLPVDLPFRRLAADRFEALYPLPGSARFLVRLGERLGDLRVVDSGRGVLERLLPEGDPLAGARLRRVHHVPENPCLLLEAEVEDRIVYGWRRLDEEKEVTADISSLFPVVPDRVIWDARQRDELFTLTGDRINRLDVGERALFPDIVSGVISMTAYGGDLLVLDRSNRFNRVRRDGGGKPERMGKSPAEVRTLWESRVGYRLLPVDEDTVFFAGPDGELYINRAPHQLMREGFRGLLAHPDEPVALVWDRHRLGRYAFAPADRDEKKLPDHIQWFHDSSIEIEQVFWCHDASHVIIAGDGRIDLLALERAGGIFTRTLANYQRGTAITYHERTGSIFYLEPETRNLMEWTVLPRRDLLSRARPAAPREVAP